MPLYPRFWLTTLLHLMVPGGWGRDRALGQWRNPAYDAARDQHPARRKYGTDRGWQTQQAAGVLHRDYSSYEEYQEHQKQGFEELLKVCGRFGNRTLAKFRLALYRRFKHLIGLVPSDAVVLCAGARHGTEVEVLRELGFRKAYGIDLNPGPDNPLVRPGDFMHLREASGSVGLIYSNCADHAFDINQFFAEHARVLAPDGYALYDLAVVLEGVRGEFEAISWGRTEDLLVLILKHFDRVVMLEREAAWMWVLVQGTRSQAE